MHFKNTASKVKPYAVRVKIVYLETRPAAPPAGAGYPLKVKPRGLCTVASRKGPPRVLLGTHPCEVVIGYLTIKSKLIPPSHRSGKSRS